MVKLVSENNENKKNESKSIKKESEGMTYIFGNYEVAIPAGIDDMMQIADLFFDEYCDIMGCEPEDLVAVLERNGYEVREYND